ncbi:MAG: methylmalonyl Co-A mutase-associated GTPase MeaB [Propionibacteriaceae bacterium]
MPDLYNIDELARAVRESSRPHIARAITLVESSRPDHRAQARDLLTELSQDSTTSIRVGITGVPGAGKSTFINAMGTKLIEEHGHKVAVLAIDPSSAKTGGSILGDRTRMGVLGTNPNAYVRPSPSGGHLGGVARATREAMTVMEAAGYGVVLVETVGVGQSEIAVAGMVDTFLMLALSRSGDQLQGIKKGILEMVDVVAVNKADGDNEGEARVSARELSIAMKLVASDANRRPPVIPCSAYTGMGLDQVWQAVLDHRAYLEESGTLTERRNQQQVSWLWNMVTSEVLATLDDSAPVTAIRNQMEADVAAGKISALEAAEDVMTAWRNGIIGT